MAEPAKQISWQGGTPQHPVPTLMSVPDGEQDTPECNQPSAFLDDLADRLAAICVERENLPAAEAVRAIPLGHRPDPRPELVVEQTMPVVGHDDIAPTASKNFGVTLYTSDGNLRALQDIEADVIRLAICRYRGRMSEVARRLNIGRSTLYRRLDELGIDHTNYRAG